MLSPTTKFSNVIVETKGTPKGFTSKASDSSLAELSVIVRLGFIGGISKTVTCAGFWSGLGWVKGFGKFPIEARLTTEGFSGVVASGSGMDTGPWVRKGFFTTSLAILLGSISGSWRDPELLGSGAGVCVGAVASAEAFELLKDNEFRAGIGDVFWGSEVCNVWAASTAVITVSWVWYISKNACSMADR